VQYQREDELRRRVNAFLCQAFALPEGDYYARLDLKALLSVKAALSDINNILTMRLTFGFLAWVSKTLQLDETAVSELRALVLGSKPSSNGYDIHFAGSVPFVAEVKCNVPINGGVKYGSAQRNGILKDVDALLNGKSKGAPVQEHYLKFMVFIDLFEVRAANKHLLSSGSLAGKRFHLLEDGEAPNNPQLVYGVYTAIEA
jgi:hypothetical protein